MHINIGQDSYTDIRTVSFAPQTDVTAATLPINEFSAEIITDDDIDIGQNVELRDGRGHLWAKYWLVRADRLDEHTVRVVGQSPLVLMQQQKMPAKMYSNASAEDVIEEIILALHSSVGSGNYTVDSAFDEATISGFCPEQTPRERLQWVLYVLGAYVETYFDRKIAIKPVPDEPVIIPIEKTFWKPNVSYNDYVTTIKGQSFAFTAGEPQTTDEWVKDNNGVTYVVTRTDISLTDSHAPSGARENIVELEDVYLVNGDNAGSIMANVAAYQFSRSVIDVDVINNGEYLPGMLVAVYVDEQTMMQGYIQSCAFSYGLQARSTLHIIGGVEIETGLLTVMYMFGQQMVDEKKIPLPIGYEYEIENPWFDTVIDKHRYVLRPTTESVTGTMASSGATVTVTCEIALDLYNGTLHVVSVDEITTQTVGSDVVGVIT